MIKLSKRMQKVYEGLDHENLYKLDEAVKLIQNKKSAKFDETLEVAINLGVDPKNSEQNVRGMISLPNGTGKTMKVAVFAKGDKAEAAKKAGADIVGAEDLAEQIAAGKLDFDRCIATPDMMVLVGKVGKILGPKGLMPNPKLGTVTPNVADAVKAAKSGSVEFRTEKAGIIHVGVGKLSFSEKALIENIKSLVSAVVKARPNGVKGTFVKKISLSSTMGPGVKLDLSSIGVDLI